MDLEFWKPGKDFEYLCEKAKQLSKFDIEALEAKVQGGGSEADRLALLEAWVQAWRNLACANFAEDRKNGKTSLDKITALSDALERKAKRIDRLEHLLDRQRKISMTRLERLRSTDAMLRRYEDGWHKRSLPVLCFDDDSPVKEIISSRVGANALMAAGIRTVGDFKKYSDNQLLGIRYFGRKDLREARVMLAYPGWK